MLRKSELEKLPPAVEVMKKLLELPDRKTPEGLRDLLALEVMYILGLRRAEVCGLTLDALCLVRETLFVVGKGGHERLLPVSPHLKFVFQDYLFNGRPKLLPRPHLRALLLDNEGRALRVCQLHYIVKKYGRKLDLKLSCHQFRHACAVHLIEAGMGLPQVQQLLGHANMNTTKIYTRISRREMEREFQRCQVRTEGPDSIELRYVKRHDARKESPLP